MLTMFSDFFSSSFLLPSTFILVIFIISVWFLSPTTKIQKNPLPSPSRLPIIGNLHQLGANPHRSLQALSNKHGPLMLLHFGRVPVLIVSSADASREIMKTHDAIFSNRPTSSVRNKLIYNAVDIAFANYGKQWRQNKSTVVTKLVSPKKVESFRQMREEETDLLVEKIKEMSCSSSPVINMNSLVLSIINGIICRTSLGKKYEGASSKELFANFIELMGVFSIGDYIPWLSFVDWLHGYEARAVKISKQLDKFLENVIEEHLAQKTEKSEEDKDYVDLLLQIQNDGDDKFTLSRDAIKAIILDVFVGGTDTTYATMVWEFTELLKNPRVMKKLQEEVRQVAKGKTKITEDDLDKMIYLKAVVKETIRMHPSAPLLAPRVCTQDVKVMGYDIEVGTQVFINQWAISRDPSIFDNPDEFRPERFLDSPIDYKGHHFELAAFGSGRRMCPGIQFAMILNDLVLANLVHQFDFVLPDGQKGEDMDISETVGLAVHRRVPLDVLAISKV
ncbi:cytochrome P450 736A117-like [Rutidosis leptorrhynchoides]|uniref:cytochrome P450 736A117-like n=1 Tax=Rutidosis leptorrhynchoides TaxID=125765 RepID=UPI003A99BF5C